MANYVLRLQHRQVKARDVSGHNGSSGSRARAASNDGGKLLFAGSLEVASVGVIVIRTNPRAFGSSHGEGPAERG